MLETHATVDRESDVGKGLGLGLGAHVLRNWRGRRWTATLIRLDEEPDKETEDGTAQASQTSANAMSVIPAEEKNPNTSDNQQQADD